MNLEKYTILNFLTVLGSAGFGAIIVALVNRRKTNAEALLAKAQTKLTEIEVYSKMIQDLNTRLERQQADFDRQQQQIITLQGQNTEYLKIINASSKRELALQRRVKQLEKELDELKNTLPNEKI